jgi:hypothetical protein
VRRLRGVREGGEGGEGRGHTLHPIPYILPYTYAGVGEGRGGGGAHTYWPWLKAVRRPPPVVGSAFAPCQLSCDKNTRVQFWALGMSVMIDRTRHASRALCLSKCIATSLGLNQLHRAGMPS